MALITFQKSGEIDSAGLSNSIKALDKTINALYGNCVISGFNVANNGTVSNGVAIAGHAVSETSTTSILSLLTGQSGTYDVYAQPSPATYSATGQPLTGMPLADGTDKAFYAISPTGTVPAGGGCLISTIVVVSGVIASVNNSPTGRVNLATQQTINAQLNKLCRQQAEFAGVLSAPLTNKYQWIVPCNLTITSVSMACLVAPVGAPIVAEIKHNSADVWTSSFYPTILANATFGTTATSPTGSAVCAANDIVTVDLTSVGTTTPGSTLTVSIAFTLNS